METKSLLYGLIGFFAGGLLVSIAATTFDKPTDQARCMSVSRSSEFAIEKSDLDHGRL